MNQQQFQKAVLAELSAIRAAVESYIFREEERRAARIRAFEEEFTSRKTKSQTEDTCLEAASSRVQEHQDSPSRPGTLHR